MYTVVINIFEYFVFYYILHHHNRVLTAILLPGILYWDICLGVCGTVYRGVLVQFVTAQSSMPQVTMHQCCVTQTAEIRECVLMHCVLHMYKSNRMTLDMC
jgi:hypothetical protein